jgi:hypothetical protein
MIPCKNLKSLALRLFAVPDQAESRKTGTPTVTVTHAVTGVDRLGPGPGPFPRLRIYCLNHRDNQVLPMMLQ